MNNILYNELENSDLNYLDVIKSQEKKDIFLEKFKKLYEISKRKQKIEKIKKLILNFNI
ncbi:MAG: hypothetical protein ACOC3Z_02085 [Nanoarchaeota archaeon]